MILRLLPVLTALAVSMQAQESSLLKTEQFTAPSSIEGGIILKEFRQLLKAGQHTKAIRKLQSLFVHPHRHLYLPDGQRMVQISLIARRELDALAPEYFQLYLELFEPWARRELAQAGLMLDREQLHKLAQAYPRCPSTAEALWRLARLEADTGNSAMVVKLIRRLHTDHPKQQDDAATWGLLAWALLRQDCTAEAATALQRCEMLNPDYPPLQSLKQRLPTPEPREAWTPPDSLTRIWKKQVSPEFRSNSFRIYSGQSEHWAAFRERGKFFVDSLLVQDDRLIHRLAFWTSIVDAATGRVLAQREDAEAARVQFRYRFRKTKPAPHRPMTVAGIGAFENDIATGITRADDDALYSIEQVFYAFNPLDPKQNPGTAIVRLRQKTLEPAWSVGRDESVPHGNWVKDVLKLPFTPGITIDGSKEDWDNQKSLKLKSSDPNSLPAEGQVAATNGGLAFFLDISDPTNFTPTKPFLGDHLRVGLMGRLDRQITTSELFIFLNENGVQYDFRSAVNKPITQNDGVPLATNITYARHEGGYVLEIFFPWQNLGRFRDRPLDLLYTFTIQVMDRDESDERSERRKRIYLRPEKAFSHYYFCRIDPPGKVTPKGPWKTNGRFFLSKPILCDKRLLVVSRTAGNLELMNLDAATGHLNWRRVLVATASPQLIPRRAAVVVADNRAYILIGRSYVACVDVADGTLNWLVAYPSSPRIDPLGRNESAEPAPAPAWAGNGLALHDNVLALFPEDRDAILCLNPTDGSLLRELPRDGFAYVLGQAGRYVYLGARKQLGCLDLQTQKWLWRRELNASGGRGTLHAGHVLVPDGREILVVDARSGKTQQRLTAPRAEGDLTNLHVSGARIYEAGGGQVALYIPSSLLSAALEKPRSVAEKFSLLHAQGEHDAALQALMQTDDLSAYRGEIISVLKKAGPESAAAARRLLESREFADDHEVRLLAILVLAKNDPKHAGIACIDLLSTAAAQPVPVDRPPARMPCLVSSHRRAGQILRQLEIRTPASMFPELPMSGLRNSNGAAAAVRDEVVRRLKELNTPHLLRLLQPENEPRKEEPKGGIQSYVLAGGIRLRGPEIFKDDYVINRDTLEVSCFRIPEARRIWATTMPGPSKGIRSLHDFPQFCLLFNGTEVSYADKANGHLAWTRNFGYLSSARLFKLQIKQSWIDGSRAVLALRLENDLALVALDCISGDLIWARQMPIGTMLALKTSDGIPAVAELRDEQLSIHRFSPVNGALLAKSQPQAVTGFLDSSHTDVLVTRGSGKVRIYGIHPFELRWESPADEDTIVGNGHIDDGLLFATSHAKDGKRFLHRIELADGRSKKAAIPMDGVERIHVHRTNNPELLVVFGSRGRKRRSWFMAPVRHGSMAVLPVLNLQRQPTASGAIACVQNRRVLLNYEGHRVDGQYRTRLSFVDIESGERSNQILATEFSSGGNILMKHREGGVLLLNRPPNYAYLMPVFAPAPEDR